MSAYDLQAARCKLAAFRNRRDRCGATLYAGRHVTVRLALDLFDRLGLAHPDRQGDIHYRDTYGASRCDWSPDADILDLPTGEPAEVTAWVELWTGDIRLEVAFTPDEVRCLQLYVDRTWNETLLKDVPLPYEGL